MLKLNGEELKNYCKGDEIVEMYRKKFTKLTTADFANVFLNFDDNDEMVKRTIRSEAFEDGITKGKTEEKLKTAKNLLKSGISEKIISDATGLSKEEINAIKLAN